MATYATLATMPDMDHSEAPRPAGSSLALPTAELTVAQQQDRTLRAASLARELGHLANQLAGLDFRVHMAAARIGWEDMIDGAEQLLVLHVTFAELYRRFLAARIREHGAEAAQVVMPLAADNRMSV